MAVTTASPEISIEDARGFIYGAIASYNERVDPNIVLEPAQVDALAHQFMTLPTSLEIPQEFLTSAEGLPIDSMSGAGDDLQPRAQLLYNLALQGLVDSVAGTAFAQIQERAAEIRERVEEGYRQVTTVMATVTASSNDWFSTDNWSDPDYWNGFDGIYATAEFQAYAARIAEHLEENPAARERIDAAASGTADALERGDHDAVRAGVDEITDELDGLEEGADPEHTKAAAIHIAATKIASQDPEFNSLSKEEQSARIQRYVTELEEIVAADPERLATLEGAMEKTRPVEEAIERIEGEMGKYLAESQIIEENVVRNGCYYTIEGFLNYNADLGYHLVDEKGEVNVYDASVLVEKSPEELITWVRDRDLLSSLDEGSREALSSYGFDPDDPDAVIAGIKEYQRLEAGPITDRGIEYL